jgi:hypothetical protein
MRARQRRTAGILTPTCVTPEFSPDACRTQKSDIWLKICDDEIYLTMFDSGWSEAEAAVAIKNLQN